MHLTSGLAIVVISLAAALNMVSRRQRLDHYRRMASGTGFIICLENILTHLPQHRGMANTYLNGDDSFLEKLTAMQATIETDIKQIEDYITRSPLPHRIVASWQPVRQGWEKLRHDIKALSANDSFERHSALIAQVLYLISDTADETGIANHPDATLGRIGITTFNLLPPIIELIGQARGIGAGAAAKGTLLTAVRIKLEFLQQRLTTTAGNAYSVIEAGLGEQGRSLVSGAVIRTSHSNTDRFLETISAKLLGNRIAISANDYFADGSQAFNSNIELFAAISRCVDRDIQEHLPRLRSARAWSTAAGILTPLILFTLWWSYG